MSPRDKPIIDRIRNYKDTLVGSEHSLFNGLMVAKVSGVTFDGRQKNLAAVKDDTPLRLSRDRHNKFDFHAVLVQAHIDEEWKDVGFVPSNINKQIAETLDAGIQLKAKVWKKTGGDNDFHHGLSITIKRNK